MGLNKKSGAIIGAGLVSLMLFQMVPPIAQDPDYHLFADQRLIWGIPHFWNAVSNFPFIVLGILGMIGVALNHMPGYLLELKWVYFVFYAGVFLTGLASTYYHLNPGNQTLIWDRFALAVTIMAFFASIWGEHISVQVGRKMAWPLICVGLASVFYWYVTESQGRGDLRFYGMVQFLPLVLIPAIMFTHRSRLTGAAYVWGLILAYFLAKAAESLDGIAYRALGGFSGHEIKHWVAAGGIFIYYLAGFRRTKRSI